MTPADDEALEQRLAEFVERREAGEILDPAEFAARYPDSPGLRQALDSLLRVEGMFPDSELAAEIVGIPEQIGPWRVLGELGRGGAGRVFRVERADGSEEAAFALKLMHPGSAGDPRRLQRFEREARVLEELDAEGIVRVHSVGEHEGCPFLVMDLVEGVACDAVEALPGTGERWHRAARLVAEVAQVVAQAHDAGVLHRDLKPANVVVRSDGAPVVIDFGLVRDPSASTLTGTGDVLGTPAFMAPEQALGAPADARTDVYGLGAILYQLVTGQVPHVGEDPVSVLRIVGSRPAPPPRAVAADVPRPLESIIRRAMAFRPERRFATATELAAALRAFAAGGALPRGSTLGWGGRLEDAWRWHRRAVLAWTGVAVVACAAWFVWSWLDAGWKADVEAQRTQLVQSAGRLRLGGAWDQVEEIGRELAALGDHPLGPYFRRAETLADPVAVALRRGDECRAEDRGAAAAAYAQAHGLGHSDGLVAGLVGLAHAADEEFELAVPDLEVARRAYPGSRAVLETLADCYRHGERYREAAPLYEDAARAANEHRLWHEAAVCWTKAEDQDRGLAALTRAFVLAGDDVPARYRRTQAACVGDPDRAIEILSALIEEYPRQASVRYNLGYVLHRQHRVVDAYDRYVQAVELDEGAVHARLMLAWIQGGMDQSCEKCAASLATRPELLDRAATQGWMEEVVELAGGADAAVLAALEPLAKANDLVDALDAAAGAYLAAPPAEATEKQLGRLLRFRQRLR